MDLLQEFDVDDCLDAVLYQGGLGFCLSRECARMLVIDK